MPTFLGPHCVEVPSREASSESAMKPSPSFAVRHVQFLVFAVLCSLYVFWSLQQLKGRAHRNVRILVRILMSPSHDEICNQRDSRW